MDYRTNYPLGWRFLGLTVREGRYPVDHEGFSVLSGGASGTAVTSFNKADRHGMCRLCQTWRIPPGVFIDFFTRVADLMT